MRSKALMPARGLRAARLASGLTQAEVARAAGVKPKNVSQWERRPPRFWGHIVRVCDLLAISADEMLGRVLPERVVDAISAADRRLLDALERQAKEMFGATFIERAGGWRRVVTYGWMGYLSRCRDDSIRTSEYDLPMLPTPRLVPGYPENWFKGWEGPRQKARRLRRPEPPQASRRITAQQAAARRLIAGAR